MGLVFDVSIRWFQIPTGSDDDYDVNGFENEDDSETFDES